MTELALLGSLLGLPSIFDPMFPATYASFFGCYPPWMEEGADSVGVKSEDHKADKSSSLLIPASPNVRIITYLCVFTYAQCVEIVTLTYILQVSTLSLISTVRLFSVHSSCTCMNQ